MLDLVAERDNLMDFGRRGEPAPSDPVGAARLLSNRLFELASQGDRDGRLPQTSIEALHTSGLPMAVFPRRQGGLGLFEDVEAQRLAAVLRLVGAGDLSVARLYEGHVNAVLLVTLYGTERQVADLAESVQLGALSAVWNAEGRHPLSATRTAAGWQLAGEKILASGAGLVSHPIVTPRTDDGVIMVIPDSIEPGRVDLTRWTPQGMRASATGTVDLSGVVLSGEPIGAPDDYSRQPIFSGGAWRFCAVHLGAAERLLDLFRAHLRSRGRDQDPYQRQRVAAAVSACVTARLWIDKAAAMTTGSHEGDAESVVAFVNLTRGVTERACLDVLDAVQRGAGLGAFMQPDPMERIARDLATYLRQPVPDAAMADAARLVLASDEPTFDLWSD